jgi:flagellar basal-body rod protein FlgC
MFGTFDVSTSALVANRVRLDAIAANLRSVDVPGNPNGPRLPPMVREVIFTVGDPAADLTGEPSATGGLEQGVSVAEVREIRAWTPRHQPGHPLADRDGNVWYADINPVEQQVNMMMAARSYEANIAAIEARKSMITAALQVLS